MSKNQILEKKGNEIVEKTLEKTEEKKITDKKKSKKTFKIIMILLLVIVILVLIFSTIFAIMNITSTKIINGIKINGIEVSGLEKNEAETKIKEVIDNINKEPIMLKYQDYEIGITPEQIGVKYNVEKVIEEAYNVGRNTNIFFDNYEIIKNKTQGINLDLEIEIEDNLFNKVIDDINGNLPGGVIQSSYYIENNELKIVKGKQGVKVNTNEIKELIKNKISILTINNEVFEMPVEIVNAENIDIDKIYNEVYKEPKDAYISKEPFEIHAHVNGIDFGISLEQVKKMLEEEKEEYIIPLKVTKPSKTTDMLGEEAFPDRLSTYSTTYDASNYNRSINLKVSANKINGVVLMPGEEFSYNKTLGQRTAAAGYKPAAAFVGGKIVNEYGGGICQTSSTLYNTVLLANLEITTRTNHGFPVGYVPVGRDATVSWGTLDFKFKNNRKYPIKIRAYASNGVVKIDILGVKQDDDYEVVLESAVTSTIKYSTQYEDDKTMEEGKEKIIQNGSNGCISEAYKILKKDGKVISRVLLSRDTYRARPKIIAKGTKKKEETKVKIEDVPSATVNKENNVTDTNVSNKKNNKVNKNTNKNEI